MTDNFTQTQLDLIDLLIERGISRELKPVVARISSLEYGINKQYEKIIEE